LYFDLNAISLTLTEILSRIGREMHA